ncbi:cryptic adenine deaminase [Raoultella terrigena]|uniref:Cryptic adenine deaminase n=1 Tax=Raoultella terrigena TaxID=577 RepID=A0A4U9D3Z4_RAOTE|nr:cryptic adenine deaminase [Raoultella terrigena]
MARAANRLIASGGGMALAQRGEILAHVAMPIAGMLPTYRRRSWRASSASCAT